MFEFGSNQFISRYSYPKTDIFHSQFPTWDILINLFVFHNYLSEMALHYLVGLAGRLAEIVTSWWTGNRQPVAVPDNVLWVIKGPEVVELFNFQMLFDVADVQLEIDMVNDLLTDDDDEDEEEFFEPVGVLEDWY
ncbi:unnamed protein product [Allacma fusca]|uniref:Uncharacterized protein n=1 Tax=Allacma fusca TaxID=39272 RepID=A0A8J2NZZ5_9HEXA|nr:unnamed protein product [Allacma fusca]